VIPVLGNGMTIERKRAGAAVSLGDRQVDRRSGRSLQEESARSRGGSGRLHPGKLAEQDIAAWMMVQYGRGGTGAPRGGGNNLCRPGVRRRTTSYTSGISTRCVSAHASATTSPIRRALRRGARCPACSLTTSPERKIYDTRRTRAQSSRGLRPGRGRRPVCVLGRSTPTSPAARSRELGVAQFAIYLHTDATSNTVDAYGQTSSDTAASSKTSTSGNLR